MKTSVCQICLKSGILCRSCSDKLERGEISHSEVKVAEVLLKMSEEKRQLREVGIKKVVDSGDMTVIICGHGDASKIIGASGQIVRRLEKELHKRVMVVEEAPDMRNFVRDILKPMRIESISTVYKHGREVVKVRAPGGRGQRLSSSDFSRIMAVVYGKEAEITGE
jgi:transcription antitermination factor NusA-like protein